MDAWCAWQVEMEPQTEVEDRVKLLNQRMARYIPPRETWTPADEALFKPTDLFSVPVDEAQVMQLKAIKYAFTRQYTLSDFYRKYCDKRGVTPDDIKSYDDLEKVPLIPDLTFKQHPSGEDFAHWIANVYTGDLPTVVIDTLTDPTFDDIVNAFNEAGLAVTLSSGTSGRHTVMPRDMRTYLTGQYASGKFVVCMHDILLVDHSLVLTPNPAESNLWVAKALAFLPDFWNDVIQGLDFRISADLASEVMTNEAKQRSASLSSELRGRITVENAIKWLERYDKATDTISLFSFPFLILGIMDALEREGKRFDFGERGTIVTGGGWKISEDKRISTADFRKRVEEMLGIPETHCLDVYAMVEMNGGCYACPEGHYLHLPYPWFKPLVLDRNLMPAGYGEWGRFAFLDPLAGSYPGFIMSGDEVRMLEHCPICDRLGPVLEPSVQRAPSEEMRGCAEEVRRVFEQDFKGGNR
ncbi:MAG: hypothetical protein ABSB81_11285 [Halobacteriota archaeon]